MVQAAEQRISFSISSSHFTFSYLRMPQRFADTCRNRAAISINTEFPSLKAPIPAPLLHLKPRFLRYIHSTHPICVNMCAAECRRGSLKLKNKNKAGLKR